jgi:ATP-dependent Clp protease ATP-binding subunit ClpA
VDDELTRLLDLARIEARTRRHDCTETEHFLAVALQVETVATALAERGLDPAELLERVALRLEARVSVGGYRDMSSPPTTAALEGLVARARKPRPWFALATKSTLLDVLLREPSVASLVFELRRGNDHRYVIERARALAIMGGHAAVGLAHVFRALLDLPSFLRTLDNAGGRADRLRAVVDAQLEEQGSDSTPGLLTEEVASLCVAKNVVSIRELCLDLTREEAAERFWIASGITPADFIRALHVPGRVPWG